MDRGILILLKGTDHSLLLFFLFHNKISLLTTIGKRKGSSDKMSAKQKAKTIICVTRPFIKSKFFESLKSF